MKTLFSGICCLFVLLVFQISESARPTVQRAEGNPDLQALGKEFFRWRAVIQPCSEDDIPRIERPEGWVPNYSPAAIKKYRETYTVFRDRLVSIPKKNWPRADSIDYLILRSAIERVNWELNVLQTPYRNPDFYCQQTLGAVFELLVISSPITDNRINNLILRLESIPQTIRDAQENLIEPIPLFTEIALSRLPDIRTKLKQTATVLKTICHPKYHNRIDSAVDKAATALEKYGAWLKSGKSSITDRFPIGREAYLYYLKQIALIPYSPEEILTMSRQEWDRAVTFETTEKLKNNTTPQPKIFASLGEQIQRQRSDEAAIRKFLKEKSIVTVPEWMPHYFHTPFPEWIKPLAFVGETDDLLSGSRLGENAVRYVREPSSQLSFFERTLAIDPRPVIIHEGIPGHMFQMALSSRNPDEIRRHFTSSGSIEGIGFYMEELMLQMGLFDDQPHSREIIYQFMRLRALRVEADLKLSLGEFSIDAAAQYLAKTVPMNPGNAIEQAQFFCNNPGQPISYQVGKVQIQKFLAETRTQKNEKFDLQEFHDYLMLNGNVPISLQRWEYLGSGDEIKKLW